MLRRPGVDLRDQVRGRTDSTGPLQHVGTHQPGPHLQVDGTDMNAVHKAAVEAVARCRAGNGPVFIEAFTTRWPGSSPLWPELATVTDITEAWEPERINGPNADWVRHHDPLLRAARELVEAGYALRDDVMSRDNAARARIAAAAEYAIASPMPDPATVADHVFA